MNVLQLTGTIDATRVGVRASKTGGVILKFEGINIRVSKANAQKICEHLRLKLGI